MEFPDLTACLAYAAICLTASVGVVHLSGYVPIDGKASEPSGIAARALLLAGAALVACLVLVGLGLAVTDVGWALSVVIAGSLFLCAPFLVQPLPSRLKGGTPGLCLFIALASVALAVGLAAIWRT